jgi:hypothetical protein
MPPEFRRRVLGLLDTGRKVRTLPADLGATQQTITPGVGSI